MEEKSYLPPQSPILIQPGDKGFETVGKAYNRMIWTFPEWANKKKKIVNPNKVWDKYGKKMTKSEMDKVLKGAYLESDSSKEVNESNNNTEMKILEKSISSAQQRLMGQAWALRKGEIDIEDINPEYQDAIERIAFGDMTDKELRKFAETKTAGLPHHVSDDAPQPGPAVKEEDVKQIPSNYIGAVSGGPKQLKTVPYFNWDAGQGKQWWANTGEKSPKKMRFVREYDSFIGKEVNEMNITSRKKIDELIDYLREVLTPFEFRTAHNQILGLVIDTSIPDYGVFFDRFKSSLKPSIVSQIPDSLKA